MSMIEAKPSVNPFTVNWETNTQIQQITTLKEISEIISSGIYNKISSGLTPEISDSYKRLLVTTFKEAEIKPTDVPIGNISKFSNALNSVVSDTSKIPKNTPPDITELLDNTFINASFIVSPPPGTQFNLLVKKPYLKKFTYAPTLPHAIKEYHHVVVKGPQRLFMEKANVLDGKLSFELFKNTAFVSSIKQHALLEYCKSLPNNVGGQILRGGKDTNLRKIKESLFANISITDFAIPTGKKESGSLVYFQTIVAVDVETEKLLKGLIQGSASTVGLNSSNSRFKIKSFNLYDHVGSKKYPKLENGDDYLDHFQSTMKLLKIISEKNKKLEPKDKYIVDLDSHITEVRDYYYFLAKNCLGYELQNDFVAKNGYIDYSFTTFNPSTGKNTGIYYLNERGASVKRYKPTNLSSKLEAQNSAESFVTNTPEKKAQLNPDAPWKTPSATYFNEVCSNNFRNILYNIDSIAKDYRKHGENMSVDIFVKSYLVDYTKESQLKNTPQRSIRKKVYNKGEVNYKKTEDVENESIIPKDLKEKIFSLVDGSFIQTTDAAFLNIIKNADQIKTTNDVYNEVLNVVPLSEIVSIAMSCVKKYLDDPIDKVRDIIIKNIRKEEIGKIMSYLSSSKLPESIVLQRIIAKEINLSGVSLSSGTSPGDTSKNLETLKNVFLSLFAKNNINKDLISIAIFSSLPAAGQMVIQIYEAAENFIEGTEDRVKSESDVEQLADKGYKLIEKYAGKYKVSINETINKSLGKIKGVDLSSVAVTDLSSLGLGGIDLDSLGLGDFDLGSLSSLGGLSLGSLGDLSNMSLGSFAKFSGLNLGDLGGLDGFGLDLNELNLTDFLSSNEINSFIGKATDLAEDAIDDAIDSALNEANKIIKDATQQFNNVLDDAQKTAEEAFNQATSYLSQVTSGINEYQKELDEIVDKTEELLKGAPKLSNPFESVGKSVEDALEKYKGVNLTGDWSEQLKETLMDFVKEYIVKMISSILKEIAKLCEGSSKSDFANLSAKPPNVDFPKDVTPVFPFTPNFLNDTITDPDVVNDIGSYVDRPPEEISEFISELSEVLTVSETCSLFSEDASGLINNSIMDKIWSGLLGLSKYEKLKKSIGSKGNLITVFALLSPFIDKEKCVLAVQGIENTKKIISQLCEPISNEALVGELLTKADRAIVSEILRKEDKAIENLLENIKDLTDLSNNFPPVFCGPEAELKEQKPIFASSMHPSAKYMQDKQLKSSYGVITDVFETDILNFKIILTNNITNIDALKNPGSKLDALFGTSLNTVDAMLATFKPPGVGDFPIPKIAEIQEKLEKQSKQTGVVARSAKQYLEGFGTKFNIEVPDGQEDGKVISLTTNYIKNDKISLSFNFSENLYQNQISERTDIIPPRTVRLRVGNDNNNVEYFTPLKANQDYKKITDNLFAGSSETQYDYALKQFFVNDSNSISFFTEITSQIIKEHAEFISTQGLFKRSNFNNLKLSRKNACAKSLLYTQDIFNSVEQTSDNIQCLFGMDVTPSPPEIAKISSFIKLYLRVLTLNEILKGIFVFGAYGFNALLAGNNQNNSLDSFYLKYLKSQIKKQMYFGAQGENKTISLRQGFPDDTDFMKYLRIEYAANNNIKNISSVTSDQIFNELITSTISFAKDHMNSILNDAGIYNIGFTDRILAQDSYELTDAFEGEIDGEFLEDLSAIEGEANAVETYNEVKKTEYSNYIFKTDFVTKSLLANILRIDEYTGNKNKALKVVDPPTVVKVDRENYYFTVPSGYYTSTDRLKNGGFFLEQGFEVSPIYKEDVDKFSNIRFDGGKKLKPFSMIDDYNLIYSLLPTQAEAAAAVTAATTLQGAALTTAYLGDDIAAGAALDAALEMQKYSQPAFEFASRAAAGGNAYTHGNSSQEGLFKYLIGGYSKFTKNQLMTGKIVVDDIVANTQGRISVGDFNAIYGKDSMDEYRMELNGFIKQAKNKATTEQKIRLNQILQKNLFYKKFNGYTTLNLLIPIEEGAPTELIYERIMLAAGISNLDPNSDQAISFKEGFAEAVFDKKYFLKEETPVGSKTPGKMFFKLPLVYFIHKYNPDDVSSDNAVSKSIIEVLNSTTVLKLYSYGDKMSDLRRGVLEGGKFNPGNITEGLENHEAPYDSPTPFPSDLYAYISESISFARLTENLQYESILSFVSVLVTEVIQKRYPTLDAGFSRTLAIIKAGLMPLIDVSKRGEDKEFYKKNNAIDLLGLEIPTVNMDLLSLIIEMFIKMMANMSDPTWKTPWFVPGPLTPLGIIAKLLDDSGAIDDIEKLLGKQDEEKDKINDSLNCGDPNDT